MTLNELIAQFRVDTDDRKKPYLFRDEDIITWLNEAEEEAALRADLLFEADDASICQIPATAGTRKYALHDLVLRVTHASFTATGSDDAPCILTLHSRLALDDAWRSRRTTTDKPRALIVDDASIELDCLPEADGLLAIECYRAPCQKMKDGKDTPEIGRFHHRFLTKWAEHRAYSRPDTETFNQPRADQAEQAFTEQFGMRPDADRRRAFEADAPPHNAGYY